MTKTEITEIIEDFKVKLEASIYEKDKIYYQEMIDYYRSELERKNDV